jgi:hypothetical protein
MCVNLHISVSLLAASVPPHGYQLSRLVMGHIHFFFMAAIKIDLQ